MFERVQQGLDRGEGLVDQGGQRGSALFGPGAPATLAITTQGAARPVGLAWITGRQLPALAEAFRRWLISSAPRNW